MEGERKEKTKPLALRAARGHKGFSQGKAMKEQGRAKVVWRR